MLAILTTHPIQYQVPLWQALARDGRVPFEVWYLTKHAAQVSHDREFGKSFAWDLDMLTGYPHQFLETAAGASPNEFWKCRLREPLANRLRDRKVKALWIQGWQVAGYWQAVWEAQKAGVEVWLRGESNDLRPSRRGLKGLIKRVILGELFRRIDRFLFIGSANRRLYKKFGVADATLYPAPYAVDNERFARQAEKLKGQRKAIREKWAISDEAFCVLFCGKLIPKKRPFDLVGAAHLLTSSKGVSDLHLLFAGSGKLDDDLRSACEVLFDAYSIPHTTGSDSTGGEAKSPASFVGFLNQTEISKAYAAADCLVLPSDYGETWGLVVNEAMASNLPCLISNQCGCAEDLGKLGSNEVLECGKVADLASGLLRARARKLAGLTLTQKPPSLDQTVNELAKIFDEI